MIACSICANSDWCDDDCDCACHDVEDEFLDDDDDDDLDDDEEIEEED